MIKNNQLTDEHLKCLIVTYMLNNNLKKLKIYNRKSEKDENLLFTVFIGEDEKGKYVMIELEFEN